MSKDYYQILEIHREALEFDVSKAYRKLSLRWHPKLCKDDYNTTLHHFSSISEAYEVLSDPIKRTFYDKYGEEKLKEGFFSNGNLQGGYRFAGNPEQIFEQFFAQSNPFANLIDGNGKEAHGSLFSHAFGAQDFKGIEAPSNLEVVVELSLNEVYNGCSKQVTYQRTILNKDGRTTKDVIVTKDIQIMQGIEEGQIIKFKELGNEVAGQKPSDLIFKIKLLTHSLFIRKGNNLIYKAHINLSNAICADPIEIITLDNRKLQIPIDEIISTKTIKEIKDEGMPEFKEYSVQNYSAPIKRGNLYVRFDIQFPKDLSEQQKLEIKELLKDSL